MAEVCKGNVYLTITNEEIEKYLAKGFSLIDPQTGKILKQSIPTEIGPLKKLYAEQLKINEELTSEIAILRNKIKLLEAEAVNSASASEDLGSWDSWSTEKATTKKKSSKK